MTYDRKRAELVANNLKDWINRQPIELLPNGNPTIAPVYAAHVLLINMINDFLKDNV
jgi:hypothetical protein